MNELLKILAIGHLKYQLQTCVLTMVGQGHPCRKISKLLTSELKIL